MDTCHRHCHRHRFAALLLLALSLSTLKAQSTKAELFGIVRDPAGLPVGGAAVDLINTAMDTRLSLKSDTNGAYHFFALPAGSYRIAVAKDGFAALRRDGIAIRVGDRIGL